jgi:hypothetical protein
LACEQADITVTMPKPMTSGAKSDGRYGKQDFVYLPTEDVYRCPAGERLTYRYTNEEDGKALRRYWTTACSCCPLKARCTTGSERRITRWEHEHVLEAVQQRLDKNPQAMRERRETVEHPFGTLKMRMGATHFLIKTLQEDSLDIDVDHLVPFVDLQKFKRRLRHQSGIVDHHVNAAEGPHSGIDQSLHLRGVGDVRGHGERFAAGTRQRLRESLEAILPSRAEHEDRALGREKPCRGFTQSVARAGDYDDLAFNVVSHDPIRLATRPDSSALRLAIRSSSAAHATCGTCFL